MLVFEYELAYIICINKFSLRSPSIAAAATWYGAEPQCRSSHVKHGPPDAHATAALNAGRASNVAGRPHGCSENDGGFHGCRRRRADGYRCSWRFAR